MGSVILLVMIVFSTIVSGIVVVDKLTGKY